MSHFEAVPVSSNCTLTMLLLLLLLPSSQGIAARHSRCATVSHLHPYLHCAIVDRRKFVLFMNL
jgi:hypothetical protein